MAKSEGSVPGIRAVSVFGLRHSFVILVSSSSFLRSRDGLLTHMDMMAA